jgi:NTP pyrophosphatase (non-canonical NTP hydrolase)
MTAIVKDEEHILSLFEAYFFTVSKLVHTTAREKGWWDNERNHGEMLALIHSEVSEALEALRAGNPPDDKIPAFSGAEAELADVVIRIMDMAEGFKWDVGGAIVAKLRMNRERERMHGGKKF